MNLRMNRRQFLSSLSAAALVAAVPLPLVRVAAKAATWARGLYYNVLDYGAWGDGVTDDTVAIQATIDAAGAAGGGIVIFPPGTYLAKQPLTVSGDITIVSARITHDHPEPVWVGKAVGGLPDVCL